MIVAVAADGEKVAPHFGRCYQYRLYNIEAGKVIAEKVVQNPGHEPGFLPGFLARMGVSCVICGGMGSRARSLFIQEKIETLSGISGEVTEAVKNYLAGELEPGPDSCEHGRSFGGCEC